MAVVGAGWFSRSLIACGMVAGLGLGAGVADSVLRPGGAVAWVLWSACPVGVLALAAGGTLLLLAPAGCFPRRGVTQLAYKAAELGGTGR